MSKFGDAERNILNLLSVGNKFNLNNNTYTITNAGKPTCKKGEPKTDIYVLASDNINTNIEIKISFKKENADFIENKTNDERAKILFGDDWQEIIIKATKSISNEFEKKYLIYKDDYGKTKNGCITLGWKYELLNKSGGNLSSEITLTNEQLLDVYAGTHLPSDKKDANVNGECIVNSGIANYMLMNDNLTTTQEIIDNIISIDSYIETHPKLFFACKALNYRTFEKKFDGNRPLSVYVDWIVVEGKLKGNLVYDNPLVTKGNFVANKLIDCLKILGIKTTDDISENLVVNPNIIYENNK